MDCTKQQAEAFLGAFQQGRTCLHPTDSVPGLTFDPTSASAIENFFSVKGRGEKGFVCLSSSLETALNFWQPLPGVCFKRYYGKFGLPR